MKKITLGALSVATIGHSASALSWFFPVTKKLLPTITGNNHGANYTALTFDDGPDPAYTPLILEALAQKGVKATFFMLGQMVDKYPSLTKEVVSEGHNIALHGYEHRNHLFRSAKTIAFDLKRGKEVVEVAAEQEIALYRPPYGVISGGTLYGCSKNGLKVVTWTNWGRDWRAAANSETVIDDVFKYNPRGGTILLHDSDCTSAPGSINSTVAALPHIIDRLHNDSIQVGPITAR
ncbi:MAG: polysaccharide deacetylase family protein [Actinomycetota bacterium]|nr:polysaccharide deacetylase family protein [Actinomycetota bacterium]